MKREDLDDLLMSIPRSDVPEGYVGPVFVLKVEGEYYCRWEDWYCCHPADEATVFLRDVFRRKGYDGALEDLYHAVIDMAAQPGTVLIFPLKAPNPDFIEKCQTATDEVAYFFRLHHPEKNTDIQLTPYPEDKFDRFYTCFKSS